MMRPAVFFDRDGVLNDIVWRNGGPASPRSAAELAIAVDARAAVDAARAAGFAVFAVTNQPDVSRGLMTAEALAQIHEAMGRTLPLHEIIACTHDNQHHCACRKPRPGMLLNLAARHGLDLAASWMIGDQDRDIACGRAAGCRTALIARPYNSAAGADLVVGSVLSAVTEILARAAPGFSPST